MIQCWYNIVDSMSHLSMKYDNINYSYDTFIEFKMQSKNDKFLGWEKIFPFLVVHNRSALINYHPFYIDTIIPFEFFVY